MEAVILAGGKGTRLKPYTSTLPKPLVPVGDKPILAIVLEGLREAGVQRVTLAVNHLADLIMSFFGSGEKFGMQIQYSEESAPLGTVGPLRLIRRLPENFIVMNGDILTDLDYSDLFRRHLASGALMTIATYNREVPVDFGVLEIDKSSSRLRGFKEKPTFQFTVSMGIYVFNRALLSYIPASRPFGFDELVLNLLAQKAPVHTYAFDGYWLDLGRPDDYDQANRDLDNLQMTRRMA